MTFIGALALIFVGALMLWTATAGAIYRGDFEDHIGFATLGLLVALAGFALGAGWL